MHSHSSASFSVENYGVVCVTVKTMYAGEKLIFVVVEISRITLSILIVLSARWDRSYSTEPP